MRFEFLELPGKDRRALVRPVVPVQVEDLEEAPQLCLVDTGSTANRFGTWLAEATGIDLSEAPETTLHVDGVTTTARHARADLTIAGVRYDAPVSFCDPWPFAFNLLGQEGFLRYFRLTLCAAEGWLEVDPEPQPLDRPASMIPLQELLRPPFARRCEGLFRRPLLEDDSRSDGVRCNLAGTACCRDSTDPRPPALTQEDSGSREEMHECKT